MGNCFSSNDENKETIVESVQFFNQLDLTDTTIIFIIF